MKRKKGYETPLIEKFRVELEDGVCATGSVMSHQDSGVVATEHTTGFEGSYSMDDEGSENGTFGMTEWK